MPDYVAFGAAQAQIGARQIAGEITEAEAATEYAAAATALNLQGPFLTVQQALTAFKGRLSDMVIGEGPPAAETGRPGVMYWDSLVPAIYGPKSADPVDPWGPGVALKGADGRVVEMRRAGAQVQWRLVGDADWTDLLPLSDITPAFEIGTVTTGEPGSSAAASISGPPSAPALNLTVPRGDAGEGDVTGPASSVDARVALFDGASGKLLKVGPSLADYRRLADLLNISDVDGLASALAAKATPADIDAAIAALVGMAPAELDTLQEIAAALADQEDNYAALVSVIAGKQPLHAILTALAALDNTAGLLEQTGASTFSRRQIGAGASSSIMTRADSDARNDGRYLALTGGDMSSRPTFNGETPWDGGNMAVVSQAEAEAGTATTARAWRADRVAQAVAAQARPPLMIALSDETTAITTGVKATIRAPYAMTLDAIPRISVNTASSSGLVTVDIKINGVSIFTTKPTIDASEKTSVTAATPAVLTASTISVADDAEMTFEVTVAGTGAKGLKATLYWRRAS